MRRHGWIGLGTLFSLALAGVGIGATRHPEVAPARKTFAVMHRSIAANVQDGGAALVLRSSGRDSWTLNGQPIAERDLGRVIRGALSVRRDKHLFVQVPESFSYAALIDVLGARLLDGAERFSLIPAGGTVKEAVALRLELIANLDENFRLPEAEMGHTATATPDAVIRWSGSGEADPSPSVVLPQVGKDAVVQLQLDPSRTLADVWRILALGRTHGIGAFLLAVERPDGPGALARACRTEDFDACWQLGMAYFAGSAGLKMDHHAAVGVLETACEREHQQSCELLGSIYASGEQIPVDATRSIRYHTESCRLGGDFSCEVLRRAGVSVPPRKPPLR